MNKQIIKVKKCKTKLIWKRSVELFVTGENALELVEKIISRDLQMI